MEAQILAWLNGDRNFAAGSALLRAAGNSSIGENETPNTKSRLFKELKALLGPGEAITSPTPVTPSGRGTYTALPAATNDVAEVARREAERLFKQLQNTRAQLFALCPQEKEEFENEGLKVQERGKLALTTLALQDKVNAAYDAFRFAETHGRMPEVATAPEGPAGDLPRRIANAQKNIYRIRKTKAGTPELAAKEAELEALKA